MDLNMLLFALPIGYVAYQAMDLLLNSKQFSSPLGKRKEGTGIALRSAAHSLSERLTFNRFFTNQKALREHWDLILLRSGNPMAWTLSDLLFYKELCAIVVAWLFWWGEVTPLWLTPVGLIVGFWMPDYYLKTKITQRKTDIQRQLPGFVDLLALALESGLDLLAATERILEKMKSSALRTELQTLIQENRLGTPRKEALQHWAFRTDSADVASLTSMIIQSEELGTSLAAALRTFAEDMRGKRMLRAEEVAGKAPVKILAPMIIFFFPVVFAIIFGPILLNLSKGWK